MRRPRRGPVPDTDFCRRKACQAFSFGTNAFLPPVPTLQDATRDKRFSRRAPLAAVGACGGGRVDCCDRAEDCGYY
jgi:hypothetical protein